MQDLEILAVAKTYTKETVIGMGALKGAPCTVQGVVDAGDGTQTLTLKWTDDNGVAHTTDISLPSAIFEITSPSNGQTLRYNSTSGKFENSNVSFSADLEDLDNVVITSVQNGQVLTYDAANNRWINADGSTVGELADLTDVVITTAQNGQFLSYDGTSGKWINVTLDIDAADVDYDNTTSGLTATDVQGAIDEIKLDISQLSASKIGYDGTASGLSANKVQGAIDELADEKVDKETGKGLSANDFTDTLKNKLDGIEENAEENDIDTVKVNGTALTPDANKAVNILLNMTKLSDVDLTDLADGMILIYDAANNKWYAGANTGATYTAGEGIEIDQNNVISSKIVLFTGTEAQWNALPLADKIKFTHYATNDDQTGQIDPVPTQNSANLMTSGGIYTALQGKANTSDLGTAAAKDSTDAVTQSSTDLVESGAVYNAIDNAVKALDVTDAAVAGSYVTEVSEADGKIAVVREAADAVPTESSNKMVKSGGVYAANEALTNKLNNEAATRSAMGAKNRLPITLASLKQTATAGTWADNVYTENGIDFTINTDASDYVTSVIASGTASGTATINLLGTGAEYAANDFAGMILTGCPSGGGNDNYRTVVHIGDNQDGTGHTAQYEDGAGVTIDTNSYLRIYIRIASGTDLTTPITFYPMIRLATDADATYQPYAKTNQQLTAENQTLTNEVDTIVNELSAKNIFDIEKWLISVGLAYTKNGDTYTTSTGGQSYGTPFAFADKDIDIVISGIITNDTSNNVRVEVLNVNNEVVATIKEDTTYASGKGCKVRLNWSVGGDFTIEKPMIRIATIEDSTYAPYAMTNRELTNGGYSILSATANTDIIDLDNLTFVKSVKVVNATGYFHTKVAAAKNALLYTFDEKTKAGNVGYKPYVLAANNSGSTFLLRVEENEIRIDENNGIPVGNYAIIGGIFVQ